MEPTRDELRLLTAADFIDDEAAGDEPAGDEPREDEPAGDEPRADEPTTQNDGAAESEPTTGSGSDDHDEDRWT
jgi:hypothetical protein